MTSYFRCRRNYGWVEITWPVRLGGLAIRKYIYLYILNLRLAICFGNNSDTSAASYSLFIFFSFDQTFCKIFFLFFNRLLCENFLFILWYAHSTTPHATYVGLNYKTRTHANCKSTRHVKSSPQPPGHSNKKQGTGTN